jgi:biotin synthase
VTRINHNLETSERFFPRICSTHSFVDRYQTVQRLKKHGMEVCCGGIIGMGEDKDDRLSLAYALRMLDVDSVPINILNPRPGTPLAACERLSVDDIIKTIAVFRLILPRAIIKIAGGREVNLGEHQVRALRAGANGIITGGYLTTRGSACEQDRALLRDAGLRVMP